ncbi:hypothetical protein IW262DRAFT_1279178 [Armillaria fumosa]|nr:hypothetical protein IW262DRAFT_1279178 [Armillaria fumosa]
MIAKPTKEEERADGTEPSPDEDYPFDNRTLCGKRTRGQICAYAGATMTLQFRNHLFTVVIFGSYARLLRWDRSSVIVSRRFNYAEHPLILFRFYKRFAQLTLAQRGRNPRISIPTKAQGWKARRVFRSYAPECWRGEALVSVRKQMRITQLALLRLTVGSGDEKRVFIIGAPRWHQPGGYSPFGRATRHGMAFCELNDETFFYKDYWREDAPHSIPESEVYDLLAKHEIPHVAQMELGGDNGLETVGHIYVSKPWARAHHKIRHLIGHLIVLITKGRPLESFETAKQLVSCVADAMEAHQRAYELAGILHRDISAGNIMMTLNPENRQGILIHWDHCALVSQFRNSSHISRTVCIVGTWKFVSAYLLENPTAEHTFVDDRESALYVLIWVTLRHLPHSLFAGHLKATREIFDKSVVDGQHDVGCGIKRNALMTDRFSIGIGLKVPGLEDCMATLCDTFAARYTRIIETRSKPPKLVALKRAARQECLTLLEKPSWFYTTLRDFAEEIKEPQKPDIDWCDNMEMIRNAGRPGSQKRGLTEKKEPPSKRRRALDGNAIPSVSLDTSD